MLDRKNRLKKRKSFNYIYRKGKVVGTRLLTLVFVFSKSKSGDSKIGFSVSKKVGNSVVRHRVTRQMRAAVREIIPSIKQNHSLIFVAKEDMHGQTTEEIKRSIIKSLEKAGLLEPQDTKRGEV